MGKSTLKFYPTKNKWNVLRNSNYFAKLQHKKEKISQYCLPTGENEIFQPNRTYQEILMSILAVQTAAIPIVMFVGLFAFLSIAVICKMCSNIFQNRAQIRFMQSLVDRGYSAAEIERILRASRANESKDSENMDEYCSWDSSLPTTRPVPPVKQSVYH
jgi:hypothetical protein